MDVVYRVDDPDDATVKVRALAFIDGVRSFAKLLRPVTFVEGTAARIGDVIASNTNHTLTWDVAADWSIDLGRVKFEILARDARGLLAFDWITIPAAGDKPALTISKDAPSNASVLDALFWLYADGNTDLHLTAGVLSGSSTSGHFKDAEICNDTSINSLALPFLFKKMNLQPASQGSVDYASVNARAQVSRWGWHAEQRSYAGIKVVIPFPPVAGLTNPIKISTSPLFNPSNTRHGLALQGDGSVIAWVVNYDWSGAASVPADLGPCTDVAAGQYFSVALKSNGTVALWGYDWGDMGTGAAGLTNVTKIAAGYSMAWALKADGQVVVLGSNQGESVPSYLFDETPLAGGSSSFVILNSSY
jgi:hypothetical protein